jgi:hypothetical protein
MTRAQFGFAAGFAAAVVWATLGFLVMIGVLVAAFAGWAVVAAIEGNWTRNDVRSWFSHERNRS